MCFRPVVAQKCRVTENVECRLSFLRYFGCIRDGGFVCPVGDCRRTAFHRVAYACGEEQGAVALVALRNRIPAEREDVVLLGGLETIRFLRSAERRCRVCFRSHALHASGCMRGHSVGDALCGGIHVGIDLHCGARKGRLRPAAVSLSERRMLTATGDVPSDEPPTVCVGNVMSREAVSLSPCTVNDLFAYRRSFRH